MNIPKIPLKTREQRSAFVAVTMAVAALLIWFIVLVSLGFWFEALIPFFFIVGGLLIYGALNLIEQWIENGADTEYEADVNWRTANAPTGTGPDPWMNPER
jgi:hypothetical protein